MPYVQRPLSESWVYAKDARLLVERATTRVREQRILLRNRTSLRGDNFIFLRTVDLPRYGVAPRLAQDDLIAHAGGRPPPFDRVDAKLVNSLNDSIGAVTWAEWTDGAGTFCVLAVRRLDDTARVLTYGADVMDVLMRNCSGGSFDAALAPIMDAAIAFPPASGARGAGPRNLSPLAAPMP
ncbi:hypothetical protein [Rhodovulum adriaticum]|uniref:hypothetical protein n=1 Tax=Rhodovulum adriaticum TaxID=35804 RepID=UPI001A9280AE|nr:hypothetical protein [Rhodovulum adriaticum]